MKMTCLQFFDRVLRFKLTIGQRAFVAVVVDQRLPRDLEGAMRDAALTMFGNIKEPVQRLPRRTVVAVFGRDSGKTQLAGGIGLYELVTADLSRVGPGDVGTVGVVAPREKTARIALRRAIALVKRTPDLSRLLNGSPRKDGFSLTRPDGYEVAFEVFAASRGGAALRGPTFIIVIFDESSQFRDERAAVNDADLYNAVMPRVLRFVLFLSTPWTKEGLFWSLANENHGEPVRAIVAIASTLLMRDNDAEIRESIDAEVQRDSDNATREYVLAGIDSFLGSGSSLFFEGSSIEDAIDDNLIIPASPLKLEVVRFAADIGLVVDESALVGCGGLKSTGNILLRVVSINVMKPEKKVPLKLSKVIETFAGDLRNYGQSSFIADGYSREPAREWADKEKIEIEARPEGNEAKFDTHVVLREAFRDRRIKLPRHARLLSQLRSVTAKPVPGGTWRISTPRRVGQAHGDIASACVLAAWSASQHAGYVPRPARTSNKGTFRYAELNECGWGRG